ncbi:MAG: hypothetical protein GXP03_03400, partial [Alphaproteobacteria bacterium]|nr:hypothetical protein [Alphaproteobacteria bacterium]
MVRHFASNAITLLIVGMTLVGGIIAWGAGQMKGAGDFTEDVVFEVKKGDRFQVISERLAEEGLISDARIFRISARYSGDHAKLKFGEYKIPAYSSMDEVLGIIVSGKALAYQVTVPEGLTSWQVVQLLNEEPLLSGEILDKDIPPEG